MDNFFKRLVKELKYIAGLGWTFKAVGEHWDKTTDYDDINERTYSYFRRFVDAAKLFDLPDQKYTLDICSRTGNGSLYFWQKGKISRVVCADVTQKMQLICAANLKKYPINFELEYFDKYPLPFGDNEFETILSFETIEHVPQPQVFIKELSRILKPAGLMVLTTPNVLWEPVHWLAAIFNIHHSEGPHRFLRHHKIKKLLKQNNLEIIREGTFVLIPGGPKPLIAFGEKLEETLPQFILRWLALRRIYICQKNK
ncbi:MAG: class I SAM-dependent methyltransferase [Patescibacteria group bacterium]